MGERAAFQPGGVTGAKAATG
ncbi:MAG: hypothetical protein JWQ88_636, partial [Rhodoferax sp.]|nr:hypothetical protein [Rhodoferax sp.]